MSFTCGPNNEIYNLKDCEIVHHINIGSDNLYILKNNDGIFFECFGWHEDGVASKNKEEVLLWCIEKLFKENDKYRNKINEIRDFIDKF